MSSIIERLTEGVVNRDMRAEGSALLSKWEKTGLLEGLDGDRQKNSMARLLENQAKELLREASSMGAGDVEGFAAVAFPIVRRVFAGLIANDLVSVQPMSLPSGLIFFLDFVFSPDAGGKDVTSTFPRMGNTNGESIYGGDKVASGITSGVELSDASTKGGFSGPLRDGATGYAYASPSGSNSTVLPAGASVQTHVFHMLDSVSEANKKLIQYDPDLLTLGTADAKSILILDVAKSEHDTTAGLADFDNLSAFIISGIVAGEITQFSGVSNLTQIRRLTTALAAADNFSNADAVRYVYTVDTASVSSTDADGVSQNLGGTIAASKTSYPLADELVASSTLGAIGGTGNELPLEGVGAIPEIDIKVDSIAVTAQTKKLKAKWTPELGQDLNAYHNLDAEVELTSILSEQVALEIDREILADLVNGATAATYYWSRSPGLFVNRETGAELGATSAAPDFTGTVSEWYETLVETINDVSAQIHRKTLRGGANFVVCSPEVANILEFTAGFRASVTHDDESGSIGAVQVGSLSKKFDVIVDPYFLRNVVLVGRRGNSFLESGYVYAPYVPLQTTPTIFGPEDFVPRKGVMTRYAKQMVRPDMYGLVVCRGLLGESGS
jgi:hypothetical protein